MNLRLNLNYVFKRYFVVLETGHQICQDDKLYKRKPGDKCNCDIFNDIDYKFKVIWCKENELNEYF